MPEQPALSGGSRHVLADGLLTEAEHAAMQATADLWNRLVGLVGGEDSRRGDLFELVVHVHAIQHAILAQAAGRAFPDRYRLLGGKIEQVQERDDD